MTLHLPSSKLQMTVATALDTFRRLFLQQAVSQTIKELDERTSELFGDIGPERVTKSPTTNRFYSLPDLLASSSAAFEDFRDRLVSMVGIIAGS